MNDDEYQWWMMGNFSIINILPNLVADIATGLFTFTRQNRNRQLYNSEANY